MTNTSDRTVANVEGGAHPPSLGQKNTKINIVRGGPPPRLGQKLCTDYCAT